MWYRVFLVLVILVQSSKTFLVTHSPFLSRSGGVYQQQSGRSGIRRCKNSPSERESESIEGISDEEIADDYYRRTKKPQSPNGDGTMKKIASTLPNLPPGMDATLTKKEQEILKEIEKARGDTEMKSDVEVLREQMKKLLDRI